MLCSKANPLLAAACILLFLANSVASQTSASTSQATGTSQDYSYPSCMSTGDCTMGSASYPKCFDATNNAIEQHACLCTDSGYLNKIYSCAAAHCNSDDFNSGIDFQYRNCEAFNVSYPAPSDFLSSVSVTVPASITVAASVSGFTATAAAIESSSKTVVGSATASSTGAQSSASTFINGESAAGRRNVAFGAAGVMAGLVAVAL